MKGAEVHGFKTAGPKTEIECLETDIADLALAAKNFLLLVSRTNAERLHAVLARPSVAKIVLAWERRQVDKGRP